MTSLRSGSKEFFFSIIQFSENLLIGISSATIHSSLESIEVLAKLPAVGLSLKHYAIFFPQLNISTSTKNFNGELGLSLSVFEITHWNPNPWTFFSTLVVALWKLAFTKKPYDIIVLEYGIDRPKEMEFLLSIAKPHIGIFTAIDAVHSEQFGNPSEIAKEEAKMVQHTREVAFLNINDVYARHLKDHLSVDVLSYQTEVSGGEADISLSSPTLKDHQGLPSSMIPIHLKGKTYSVETNLFGMANYGYIGVALAISEIIGHRYHLNVPELSHHTKTSTLSLSYTLQAGRFSFFRGIEESLLVDSTYNASPLSMRSIINTVWSMKQQLFPSRPLRLVLGDMRELGDLTEKEHRLLAAYVSQVADYVFLIGVNMTTHMADELEKIGYPLEQIYKFHCSRSAGTILKKMIIHNNEEQQSPIIVFKGSQNSIFLEEAVKLLLENPADETRLPRQGKRWMKKKGC